MHRRRWLRFIISGYVMMLYIATTACAAQLPAYLVSDFFQRVDFVCTHQPDASEDPKIRDVMWQETLKYIEGYVRALTTSSDDWCKYSAVALVSSHGPQNGTPHYQCVMDYQDMQEVVRHLWSVLLQPDKAKRCFSLKQADTSRFDPSIALKKSSSLGNVLPRSTLQAFYDNIQGLSFARYGQRFAKSFDRMVTGEQMKTPIGYPFDVSANALTNLWAHVGWVPMYAFEDKRSNKIGMSRIRGGYAYAEVVGPHGLLNIATVNGEPFSVELGMTVQMAGTLYPEHYHNVPEQYFTLSESKCMNNVQNLMVSPHTPLCLLEKHKGADSLVCRPSNHWNYEHMWTGSQPDKDALLYIPRNHLHAFAVGDLCQIDPDQTAHVSVWARSNVRNPHNDGTTRVCDAVNLQEGQERDRFTAFECRPELFRF